MLLSIFTPTHDPRHLAETHASLLTQDLAQFEWVILLNGKARRDALPPAVTADPRVRIHESRCGSDKVGALKREACDLCRGEVFAELDHDDILTSDCLSRVARAFEHGAGFAYTDSAVFDLGKMRSEGYRADCGWEHYEIGVYGRRYVATKCFPITPRSLCEVYYAPDHLRAWSRRAYYTAGGHDPSLSVGDDHDLMCRTYLSGAPFVHAGGCGYLYRKHAGNTVDARQGQIQKQVADNRRRFLRPLVYEWCRREGLAVLDLAAERAAGRWNPLRGDRLPDGHVGAIVAREVLQYVPPRRQVAFFNTAWRRLVPGGFLLIDVPSESGRYASMDPRHLTRFNPNSFLYYTRREYAATLPGVTCRFDLVHQEEHFPAEEYRRRGMSVLRADLSALKGQRHPGPVLI